MVLQILLMTELGACRYCSSAA